MNQLIAWAGFLGAWLLVAGPLYQGAIELLGAAVLNTALRMNRDARAPEPGQEAA